MRKSLLLAASILLFNLALFSQQTYQLDIKKSQLEWTGKAAFSNYSLSGTLDAQSGFLTLKEDQIQTSEIIVNTKSIDSPTKQLVKHLKSEDFFEVKKYPKAYFELEKMLTINGQLTAQGWLTIKDKKVAFECPVEVSQSNNQISIKGATNINRLTYGINYNSPSIFASLKDQAIADEFELKWELVFE